MRDNSEIILSHRQRLIEEKLLKCYTDEVASEICKLVHSVSLSVPMLYQMCNEI